MPLAKLMNLIMLIEDELAKPIKQRHEKFNARWISASG